MILMLVESVNGGWNYAPLAADCLLHGMRYCDDAPYPTIEAAILGAERDKTLKGHRPLHYVPMFTKKGD